MKIQIYFIFYVFIFRDRYNEELAVWLDEQGELGAIVPSVTPAGTVTRRATHKLWLTSANPKDKVIGSDLVGPS